MRRRRIIAARLLVLLAASGVMGGCVRDSSVGIEKQRVESFDLLTKGQQLKAQGDYVLARDTLLKAAETSQRPVIYYEIGNCYYRLNNPEQASAYYEKALAMAPDYALARAELDLVQAQIKRREGETVVSSVPARTPEPRREEATVTVAPLPVVEAPRPMVEATPVPTPEATMVAETTVPAPRVTVSQDTETGPSLSVERVTPTSTPEPTPTPAAAIHSQPLPKAAPAVHSQELPAAKSGHEGALKEDSREKEPAASGPFSGLTTAFEGLSPKSSKKTVAGEEITPAQARQVVFPELSSDARVDAATEREAARRAEQLGQFDEAVRSWNRALSAEPDNTDSRLSLAAALQRTGRTRRAESELLLAAKLDADSPKVYFDTGNYYVREKEFEKARDAFERAIELDPEFYRAKNNLAAVQLQLGNPGAALRTLLEVTTRQPEFASAWLNLALTQDALGQPPVSIIVSLESYLRYAEGPDPRSERWLESLKKKAGVR